LPKYHEICGPGFFLLLPGPETTLTSLISRNVVSVNKKHGGIMRIKSIGKFGTLALIIMSALSLSLAGCGSGDGTSSQAVSGVAAAGAALTG
jgi:hypothetical protein